METVKDFFKNINYRLSSPFIFSFVVSWLICNWQIPVALIFYNTELTQVECLKDLIDFIKGYINWNSSLWCPLGGAAFYTFCFPYINKEIKDYQTKVEVKAEKSELKIREGSSIPIDKYLGLRSTLVEKQKQLEIIIKDESTTQVKLQEKINENNQLVLEKNHLADQWNAAKVDLEIYNTLKKEIQTPETLETFFPNDWVCEFFVAEATKNTKNQLTFEPFNITGADYYTNRKSKFKIGHIRYVDFLKTLIFHKMNTKLPDNGDHIATITRVQNDFWVGTEKLPGGIISYVRYYPLNKIPDYYPLYTHEKELHNMDIFHTHVQQIEKWRSAEK